MLDNFSQEQCNEFMEFCKRHDIIFNNIPEYVAAINQYFKDESK